MASMAPDNVAREYDAAVIKHLELIQVVIARLGSNGFVVKGWAVTVAGLFLGFAVESSNYRLALISVLPTLAFWYLDTYFLRSERLFRSLYDRVRRGEPPVEPFYMAATSSDFVGSLDSPPTNAGVMFSATLRGLYLALLGAAVLTIVVIEVAPRAIV